MITQHAPTRAEHAQSAALALLAASPGSWAAQHARQRMRASAVTSAERRAAFRVARFILRFTPTI